MSLLVYASEQEQVGRRLHDTIHNLDPAPETEFVDNFPSLSARLHGVRGDIQVAVFLARDRQELDALLSMREFLQGLRIVLVLPDSEEETISKGHRLHPRYIAQSQGNFNDVAAVLGRMLRNAPAVVSQEG